MNFKDFLNEFRKVFKFRMWFVSAFGTKLYGFGIHTLQNKAEEIVERKLREIKEE